MGVPGRVQPDLSGLTKSLLEVENVTRDLSWHYRDGTVHSNQALLAQGSSYLRRMILQHVLKEGGGGEKGAGQPPLAQPQVALTTFLIMGGAGGQGGQRLQR